MNKIRANYQNDQQNKIVNYRCIGCKNETENNSHIMKFPAYKSLRNIPGRCLLSDQGIVEYFCDVMKERMKKGTQDKEL